MGDNIRVIDFGTFDKTTLEPLTMVLALMACVMVFCLRRNLAIIPMIIVASLIPYPERIRVGILDFDMLRMVLACALIRVMARREMSELRLTSLDKFYLAWATVMVIVPVIADLDHLVQSLGFALDNIAEYLVIRSLIKDETSLKPIATAFVLLSVPVCAGMLTEHYLGKNLFYLLGSSPEVVIREGAVRATAGFDHPILAGTYGALVFPLAFVLRHGNSRGRALWIIGMVSSFLIVWASKSSGPLYAFVAGVLAIALWPLRRQVKTIRNLMWIALIFFQLVMSAPVWALIFRIPEVAGMVSGSTSFHRYELITLSMQHIGEWWLMGTSLDNIARWEWGIQDITNQYLLVGFASGLAGMILFIMVLVKGFSIIGRYVRFADEDSLAARYAWVVGSLLFVHVMAFFGVSYFSGFWFFLQLTLALTVVYSWSHERKEQEQVAESQLEPAASFEAQSDLKIQGCAFPAGCN